jgi:hypothetical protein
MRTFGDIILGIAFAASALAAVATLPSLRPPPHGHGVVRIEDLPWPQAADPAPLPVWIAAAG